MCTENPRCKRRHQSRRSLAIHHYLCRLAAGAPPPAKRLLTANCSLEGQKALALTKASVHGYLEGQRTSAFEKAPKIVHAAARQTLYLLRRGQLENLP
mmetsp:Transcript_92868/g.289543  ORF Transcript_92868/g.289543 Transcript_92868/m.289543 type:complete len:98 (-) Transcript_92868:26-319(-)